MLDGGLRLRDLANVTAFFGNVCELGPSGRRTGSRLRSQIWSSISTKCVARQIPQAIFPPSTPSAVDTGCHPARAGLTPHQVYSIVDELFMAGEIQETSASARPALSDRAGKAVVLDRLAMLEALP